MIAFLTPLMLLLGLLAAPIILLYMLRLRRQEMLVSSTMLWQRLLRDREANAPWQKLRRNLLLILQLLILGLLIFALARPFLPVPSVISGSVVVLLDGSASMLATDVEPNRFAAATAEVENLIDNLAGTDQMTLILVGAEPAVLVAAANDRAVLRAALAEAAAAPAVANWPAAFALANGAAQGFQEARVVVVSDGGLPEGLPPLPGDSLYLPIGASAENLALTALATRDTEAGPQLFAQVVNYGQQTQTALLSIRLDGTLFDSRRVEVPAGENANLTWQIPDSTATISADLGELSQDYLATDNEAWAVHEGGISNRALLISEGNLFLEQLYGVLPGIDAFRADPEQPLTGEGSEPFDLYIFDGVPLPETLPDGDLLIINPQPTTNTTPLLEVGAVFSDTVVTQLVNSPLLNFVDWSGVQILQARAVTAPWAQTLVGAVGGPLVLTGEQNGRRVAIITFDLRQSDLPLRIAFPILMANITNWLSPGRAFDAPNGLQVGAPVSILPGASTTEVLVTAPDGSEWEQEVTGSSILYTETTLPGLYEVTLRDATGEQPAGQFAVNLFTADESQIAVETTIRLGQTDVTAPTEEDVGQRELWYWLALLGFLVLLLEWWVHHRGARWPDWGWLQRRNA